MGSENKINRWFLALCFLIIIGIVPVIQFSREIMLREPIQEMDIYRQPPTVSNLRNYEDELEDNSVVAESIRPWYQWLSTYLINKGNAKVVVGKDGWLFYRPALDYILKPGSAFYREKGALPAIEAFDKNLKAQGVHLILLPIPGKVSIYPEYLSGRYDRYSGSPANPHAPEFFRILREKGVDVFDPAELLWKAKKDKAEALYMSQDTHWTPSGMKLVAQALAESIGKNGWIDDLPTKEYKTEKMKVKRYGDLYDMLNIPSVGGKFEPLEITVERVLEAETGRPCEWSKESPIVLLGDSFINVFSSADMGWGSNAGFGEHLSEQLKTPMDVIAVNDGGATTSRQILSRRTNALAGKKMVIWQFPTRDLTNPESEWEITEIPEPEKAVPPMASEEGELVVTGEVLIPSSVPDPDQVPYTECLTYVKYRIISVEAGEYGEGELLAVFWGMRDSKLMPAASFQPGQKHRLHLEPLSEHDELSHIMQADDTDDYEHIPFWVTEFSEI